MTSLVEWMQNLQRNWLSQAFSIYDCHIPEVPNVTFIFVTNLSSTKKLNTAHNLRQQTDYFIFKKVQAKFSALGLNSLTDISLFLQAN